MFTIEPISWQVGCGELYGIRRTVFVEEQKVPEEIEIDEWDPLCRHVIARDAEGRPIGCGRLLPDGHIGRMAVLATWRGSGVGRRLLQTLIAIAREAGMAEALLSAQVQALGFYEKEGFVAEGPVYEEAGILHRAMRLKLVGGQQS